MFQLFVIASLWVKNDVGWVVDPKRIVAVVKMIDTLLRAGLDSKVTDILGESFWVIESSWVFFVMRLITEKD